MSDRPLNFPATPWVIKPQVPDEIFNQLYSASATVGNNSRVGLHLPTKLTMS